LTSPHPARPPRREPVEVGAAAACRVCNQPLTDEIETCNNCDHPFHLRKREDSTAPDCGEVWINEQFLALEFACDICLGKVPDPDKKSEPPVAPSH